MRWSKSDLKGWYAMERMDRFNGAMLGCAVGDALGYLIEFMNMKSIQKKYGPHGLRTVLKLSSNGNKSIISDDTQLALFTMDGLLWAKEEQLPLAEGLHRAYLRWYYTQTERLPDPMLAPWMKQQSHEKNWGYDIMAEKELWNRRAPGKSCLIALATGMQFSLERRANTCRSSAVLSRAIPLGLWAAGDPEKAFAIAKEAALLTHGSSTAYFTAATLAAMISLLVAGKEMGAAITGGLRILQQEDEDNDILKAVLQAVDEAVTDRNPVRSMKKIGLGWKAEEALALSIYCILKTSNVKDAVLMACNQDGDSDTCGAVCGSMTGALYGPASIPKSWTRNLEGIDLLHHLTNAIYDASEQSAAPALENAAE